MLAQVELLGRSKQEAYERSIELLAMVGLADRAFRYPAVLSGGQQQRVAIARALINMPHILFADEPTGNLDSVTGARVEDVLFDLNRQRGITLVVVTHDEELAARCDRAVFVRDGLLEASEPVAA